MKITQVISPFLAAPDSMTARTVAAASASIERALKFTRDLAPDVEVEVVAAFLPGDEASVPGFVRKGRALGRTLMDVLDAQPRRRLPLIGDVLNVGAALGDGDLLVFSNSDIGVQPHFYATLARMALTSLSFGINRRDIDPAIIDPAHVPLMCAQRGAPGRGTDTFVFPRLHAARFDLGPIAIGLPAIEYALLANMDVQAGFKAKLFRHLHLTFHHRQDRVWLKQWQLRHHNEGHARAVCRRLIAAHPRFPGASLFDAMQSMTGAGPRKSKTLGHKLLRAIGLRDTRRYDRV